MYCGGRLVIRNGKNGSFYGCSNFPNCKFTQKT
ncbi:MAG: topoisomerase DNA-binding C4 zinc finger domain-containing protein [Bacteroidales bacterium]